MEKHFHLRLLGVLTLSAGKPLNKRKWKIMDVRSCHTLKKVVASA